MTLPVRAKAFFLLELLTIMYEAAPMRPPYSPTLGRSWISRENRKALGLYMLVIIPFSTFLWLCVENLRMAARL